MTVASVFGVGAPEALLVGVVALVVFGPKGLAEVYCSTCSSASNTRYHQTMLPCKVMRFTQAAKSLGSSLRGFAPTIRELAGVSNELKQTLEQEIGLDEIRREWRDGSLPPSMQTRRQQQQPEASSSNRLDSDAQAEQKAPEKELKEVSEQMAQQLDPDIDRRRAESARMAWGDTSNADSSQSSNESQELDRAPKSDSSVAPKAKGSSMEGMSIEELEAELARRRNKQTSGSSSS